MSIASVERRDPGRSPGPELHVLMVAHAALHDALQSECGCPGLSASTADDGSERASPVLRQHSSSGPPDTNEASSAPRLEHQGQPRPPDLAHSEPGTPAPNATAVGPCLLHRQAPQADEGDASSALFAAYPELLWEVARKALADEVRHLAMIASLLPEGTSQ